MQSGGFSFPYSLDNKRYHTLNYHNMTVYGKKMYKAVIDAGFSCPNKDGTKGTGGCIFCLGGSGYFTNGGLSVTEQLLLEKQRISRSCRDCLITAYFQAGTNTHAPVEVLQKAYYEALCAGADGICIGTRADCLPKDVLQLLCELNEKTNLTVELGLQSVHDKTAAAINRCYTHEEFLRGYNALQSLGIRTCLHIIDGLPGEDFSDMLETARQVGQLHAQAVKLHLLHVNKGTRLYELYLDGKYAPLQKEQYIEIIVKQLEYLPQDIVIERITGDGDKKMLAAPLWSMDKISVLGGIDKLQAQINSYQGKALEKTAAP